MEISNTREMAFSESIPGMPLPGLPLADGGAGDVEPLGKLLLGPALLMAQGLQFFMKFHGTPPGCFKTSVAHKTVRRKAAADRF